MTPCVQSALSSKDERMQPQIWEHPKMAFTLDMTVFKKKKKDLLRCSDNCYHFDKENM